MYRDWWVPVTQEELEAELEAAEEEWQRREDAAMDQPGEEEEWKGKNSSVDVNR